MYATLGLVCDGLTLLGRDDVTPKTVRKLRNAIFESIVCPYSLVSMKDPEEKKQIGTSITNASINKCSVNKYVVNNKYGVINNQA